MQRANETDATEQECAAWARVIAPADLLRENVTQLRDAHRSEGGPTPVTALNERASAFQDALDGLEQSRCAACYRTDLLWSEDRRVTCLSASPRGAPQSSAELQQAMKLGCLRARRLFEGA